MGGRRTKIVATLGPASHDEWVVSQLVEAGVNVFRLNFSHGTREEHALRIERVRLAAQKADRPVAVIQDLQGPRIRTGRLRDPAGVRLEEGKTVTIAPGDFAGDQHRIATSYPNLAKDVKPGDTILLSDGLIELKVTSVNPPEVTCEVVVGDVLGERKGMNLPNIDVSINAPTEKDLDDLAFGLEHGVDWVALSFVRRAEDIVRLKDAMARMGRTDVPVIAKIERPEALRELDAILSIADGVMVARGDLGIEMPTEAVPVAQKRIIAAANARAVPVITATQMLDSMVTRRRPTRAEASDVANAILDGTDAVMLSAETSIGNHPVRTVEMMARIAEEAEQLLKGEPSVQTFTPPSAALSRAHALARAACRVAQDLKAQAIVAFTMTGTTARFMSQQRPKIPIYALTPNEATCRRLSLNWGVRSIMLPLFRSTDEMIERGEERLLELGLAEVGQTMVCVAGGSTSTPGGTDMLKIHYFDGKNPYAGKART
jgi:pyruvate kinase